MALPKTHLPSATYQPHALLLTKAIFRSSDDQTLSMRTQGLCMYPCIRPGDLLVINTRPLSKVRIGDIAVCRRQGYLFGHRVIMKGMDNGKPYIITRPDRTKKSNDGPTYGQDLLGVVAHIERRGRRISPAPQKYTLAERLFFPARLALYQFQPVFAKGCIKVLALFQKLPVYRSLAQTWLAAANIRFGFEVRIPFQTDSLKNFYHPITPDAFDMANMEWQGGPVTCWILAITPFHGRRPAAAATFRLNRHDQASDWRLDDLNVRARYRGIGLEKKLIRRAAEIISRGQISRPKDPL